MNDAAPSQSGQALPPDAGERERIVRRAALVSAGTGLSRILGFARDMLIAHFLGAGPVADVFLAVLRLPNILRRLLTEGAVAMPFTPLYLNLARTEGETRANAFARAARIKTETLRTDPNIFDVWPQLVTAAERLANFAPNENAGSAGNLSDGHSISDGLQLIRAGRDLIFFITRARTPMPKSTNEYIERCRAYLETGLAPTAPTPLPA